MTKHLLKFKEQSWAPMKITMLLHFRCCVTPYPDACGRGSPAFDTFVKQLLAESLIAPHEKFETYRTTPAGDERVSRICRSAAND